MRHCAVAIWATRAAPMAHSCSRAMGATTVAWMVAMAATSAKEMGGGAVDDVTMSALVVLVKPGGGRRVRCYVARAPGVSSTKMPGIKLNAPTNSTQKLKLIGGGGQFTYIIFQHSPHVDPLLGLKRGIGAINNYFI
jgi:hypothetical protein